MSAKRDSGRNKKYAQHSLRFLSSMFLLSIFLLKDEYQYF